MAVIRASVPSRIDFAGGWSDVPDFAGEEGGAVLNAAIDRYVEGQACWDERGLTLDYRLDLPPDSHLGTSSSTNLAWVELIDGLTGKQRTPVERAELAWRIEQLMGEKGGKQDQYAAALGGINLLRFAGAEDQAEIDPVLLGDDRLAALSARLLLCHAGPSPDSGKQHEQVWQRFGAGDAHVRDTLRAIRDTAEPARDALAAGNWPALGALLTRNRELARSLGGGAISDRMDALFNAGDAAGALGAKPCGAGGGGYLLFLVEPDRRAPTESALIEAGGAVLPFGFAPRRDGQTKR